MYGIHAGRFVYIIMRFDEYRTRSNSSVVKSHTYADMFATAQPQHNGQHTYMRARAHTYIHTNTHISR